MAPGPGGCRQRLQQRLQFGIGHAVEPDHAGAQPGQVAPDRIKRGIGRQRFESRRPGHRIALGCFSRKAEFRHHPVAVRRRADDLHQRLFGLGATILARGFQGAFKPRADGLGLLLLLPGIIAPAGNSQHQQHGQPDDDIAIAPPEGRHPVAADILINLTKNIAHSSCPARELCYAGRARRFVACR